MQPKQNLKLNIIFGLFFLYTEILNIIFGLFFLYTKIRKFIVIYFKFQYQKCYFRISFKFSDNYIRK